MPPVRLLPKAFFTNRCRQTAVSEKGSKRISQEEIKKVETMKLNGAQIVIETLIEQGTTTVFGYPGGQVINIYDALYLASDRIHHIITAHEQGASTQQTATPEQPEKLALSSQLPAQVQPIWSLVSQRLIWTPFRWLPSLAMFQTL